jgi:hypothetical protein
MQKQLTLEAMNVYKEISKTITDPETAQAMTATILISCDKGCVYTQGDFDIPNYETPAETAKPPAVSPEPVTEKKQESAEKAESMPEECPNPLKLDRNEVPPPEGKTETSHTALPSAKPKPVNNVKSLVDPHIPGQIMRTNHGQGRPLRSTAEEKLKGYDRRGLKWTVCGYHPIERIDYTAGDGRTFQLCALCGEYLNADGKRVATKNSEPGMG